MISTVGLEFAEQPHNLSARFRIHRQEVDDVRPIVATSVAVAEQFRGNRVAVGLVVDQNAAEGLACFRVERFQQSAGLASSSVIRPMMLDADASGEIRPGGVECSGAHRHGPCVLPCLERM